MSDRIAPAPFKWLAVIVAATFLAGCQTYQQQNTIATPWRACNLPKAELAAANKTAKHGKGKDGVIWWLEHGTVLRAAGKAQASNKALEQAEQRINQYSQEAKTKVANEAGAILSNQANLPYRGRAYDGIMLNTYKALNYLQSGEPDKARVELTRAYQRQQDAVEDNKKEIEKTKAAAEKEKEKAKVQKAQDNPQFKEKMSKSYANLETLKAYEDYVNPFTVYFDGLFNMANASGQSDLERANKSLERAAVFAPENKHVKADLETIQGVLQGKPTAPTTYVIFETGCAPVRDQIRIDIPILVASVSYVGAAFPVLKFVEDYHACLNVKAGDCAESTATVCSMDSVIGKDFKNELPIIITKTLTSTIVKAAAATAINEAARQQDAAVGAIAKLATAAAQAAMNIADLRTWTTLPKEFQVCRIPTPADRKIELSTPNGGQKVSLTIEEGTFNIVYVKSINTASPLLVSQMKLK